MRRVLLLAIVVLGSSFVQLDTKENQVQQARPVITWIGSTMSFEPGLVSIRGQNFDLVRGVEIGGAAVELVRRSANELVILPPSMDPGFAKLALVLPNDRVWGTVEFTPSLRAARLGNELQIALNPGEQGLAWIYWSTRALEMPFEIPGTYYPLMIDLDAPRSGQVCSEYFLTGEPLFVTAPFPFELDFIGMSSPLYLQAWCLLGGEEGYQCHTNMAVVPPIKFQPHVLGR